MFNKAAAIYVNMHAQRLGTVVLVLFAITMPLASAGIAVAYTPGDEAAIFGHTFAEEYWTNSSINVATSGGGTASLTASYVHVDDFQAFLIAFNEIHTTDGKRLVLPYQLFGMHFKTPANKEVFIGSIFAFLLVHNETYGNNHLPDVGNEPAWYLVPMASDSPWTDVTTEVAPIPAQKLGTGHYRFGMRYTDVVARVVDTSSSNFLLSLLLPILTVLISEIVIEYDIVINNDGIVNAETVYTIGQVTRAKFLGLIDVDPADIIKPSMEISAVHYLAVFTSKYNVTRTTNGKTLQVPTQTSPLDDNITIRIGDDNERAFDIGLGRRYALINETTTPWTTVNSSISALNCLVAAHPNDFLLIAWQAPFSALVFAHMAYGLSAHIRAHYATVGLLIANVMTAFHSSTWWYAVTFPEWHGLRVEQDPVYVAYTNVSITGGGGNLLVLGLLGVAVVGVVIIISRRR